jgi:translation elongation factor P/translation initiation factor 5A
MANMDDEDFNYEGMEKIFVSEVKIGTVAMLKSRPCRVSYYSAGKTGKHGAAKAIIKGTDVITDKHIEYSASTSKSVWIPTVERKSFSYVDLQDDYLHVQGDNGEVFNYKVNLEDDLIKYIINNSSNEKLLIVILFVIGEHRVVDARIEK